MRDLKSWLVRQIVFCLAASLVVQLGAAETIPGMRTSSAAGNVQSTEAQTAGGAGGGRATIAEAAAPTAYPETPGVQQTPSSNQPPQTTAPQPTQNKQDTQTTSPLGTAAAPFQRQQGVSASKPGGAAIAPGKQRRIRSFAIRVGLLVGAGIAIGVVTAATLGSPSRP